MIVFNFLLRQVNNSNGQSFLQDQSVREKDAFHI